MKFFGQKKKQDFNAVPPEIQTAERCGNENFSLPFYAEECEKQLYDRLRFAVPVIDAALSKIVRLTGGYAVISSDADMQEEPYEYLKASVYMIRTDANKDLIAEIEGGIKKEVSISCSAQKKKCSVCGCDKDTAVCSHMKGRMYSGKLCHTVLDDVTDAYEWSFVAVPAQVNAGVTKHYTENETHFTDADVNALKNARQDIFRDIIRLAFMNGGEVYSKSVSDMAENLDMQSLITLKHKLEKNVPTEIGCQLFEENEESVEAFSIK